MHNHLSMEEFVAIIFSIGTPFCLCLFCCMRCFDLYLQERKNRELENIQYSESDSEFDSEIEREIESESESEVLSPRSIRVINKYGHYKPDYSSESEYTSESDYASENDTEIEVSPIPRAYG